MSSFYLISPSKSRCLLVSWAIFSFNIWSKMAPIYAAYIVESLYKILDFKGFPEGP